MGPDIVCEPVSRNEIILTVAAVALIGFSLIVSLLVPRWRPDFPGARTGLFAVVAALLVFGMLGAVEVFGAEDHGGEEASHETVEEGPGGGQATVEEPDTGPTDTGGGDAAQIEEGGALYESNGCGGCHTMDPPGSTGTTGPNLDDLQPSFDAVVAQVTDGGGGMPAFGGTLSPDEIDAVAAYVVDATSR
jgi:mono/diheme cytochrome c family protein